METIYKENFLSLMGKVLKMLFIKLKQNQA